MSKSFQDALIALSTADDFFNAANEWEYVETHEGDGVVPITCICGVIIKEEIHLRNKLSGERAIIGNVCIVRLKAIHDAAYTVFSADAIECAHCHDEKPYNRKEKHCKMCRTECGCGERKPTKALHCNGCKTCAGGCGQKLAKIYHGKGIKCADCIRTEYINGLPKCGLCGIPNSNEKPNCDPCTQQEYLRNLPPCVSCGCEKTTDDPNCTMCRTPIGFSNYSHLTPPQLVAQQAKFANWVCLKTKRTDLKKKLKQIAQRSLKK
jgi:hypothetical protein